MEAEKTEARAEELRIYQAETDYQVWRANAALAGQGHMTYDLKAMCFIEGERKWAELFIYEEGSAVPLNRKRTGRLVLPGMSPENVAWLAGLEIEACKDTLRREGGE